LDGSNRPATVSEFARGLRSPIDAIITRMGSLLLLDFAGDIWEVRTRLPADVRDLPPPQPSPTP
jgi:hypothetical protein